MASCPPKSPPERRIAHLANVEIRQAEDDQGGLTFRGHAAVFNQLSEDLLGFREQIAPDAFADVLDDDVRLLINHDPWPVLARTTSGTLSLSQDDDGLLTEADLADVSGARDLQVSLERGDVSQMSFGFLAGEDEWEESDGDLPIRTVTKIAELFDVSVVTFPAYPQTDAAMRSLEDWRRRQSVEPYRRELRRRRMRLYA